MKKNIKNQRQNIEAPIEALKEAIFNLHECTSKWVQSRSVKESFHDQIVWEGVVQVFELIDHPKAKKCYAWSYIVDELGKEKRKFIVVLHEGPIDSPEKAVKAFIVSEYKSSTRS